MNVFNKDQIIKDRKNCECCSLSLLVESSLLMSKLLFSIVSNVINFQKGSKMCPVPGGVSKTFSQ